MWRLRQKMKSAVEQAARERKKTGEEEGVSGTAVRAAEVGAPGVKAWAKDNSGKRMRTEQAEKKKMKEKSANRKEGGGLRGGGGPASGTAGRDKGRVGTITCAWAFTC